MRRVILNFHGLGQPTRALEPGEALYWVPADLFAQTLDLARSLKGKVETHITFDDGNASDLTLAAPLLAEHAMHAQFFVLSDRIGEAGSLSATDMHELQKAGHSIGTHGASHVDWKALDAAGQTREFDHARTAIAGVTGQPVTAAAIPFGRYNGAVLRALKSRGYTHVYSSDGGAWRSDRAPIPRTSPRSDMTIEDIENVMLGREPVLRPLRRRVVGMIKRHL
ncbi:MAG: polysaccharide deacetylase family protein [Pseudomonadota bacterium]